MFTKTSTPGKEEKKMREFFVTARVTVEKIDGTRRKLWREKIEERGIHQMTTHNNKNIKTCMYV